MSMKCYKYRLITRSDFDGLVCALLLKEMNILDEILFVHPKDVQDGHVDVTDRDIITNLPYDDRCHLCFDHHASEELRAGEATATNHVLDADAESAARVVYNYYGGRTQFPNVDLEMMQAVDRADSAQFSRSEVLAPTGWPLLSFLMDPRTGLGRFRKFRISNYNLMMALIDYCRDHTVDDVLRLVDVCERVEVYNAHREPFCDQLGRCGMVHDNVVVIDLRHEETIYSGNRFVVYALFPECNVSIYLMHGRGGVNTVLAMGKSIFNRTNPAHIGELALRHGGGGHPAAGTCQVEHDQVDDVLVDLITELNRNHDVEREAARQGDRVMARV